MILRVVSPPNSGVFRARRVAAVLGLCFLAIIYTACASDVSPQPLTVAAAANVRFAFEELGAFYQEESGARVTFVFDSTGTLAQQIRNGAPFDVFAAADEITIDSLMEAGLLDGDTRRLYAQGQLVLVVNRESGVVANTLEDLDDPPVTRIAIANPEHAPYGQAAIQALKTAGLWEAVEGKLVWAENVRQALQFVQTGNASVGLVARSIAEVPEVSSVAVPATLYAPINQAMAVVQNSTRPAAARAFVDFVTGPVGRQVLKRYGYLLPGEF